MLRSSLFLITAVAALLPAAAGAVTVTSSLGAPDPGAPGQTLLVDFEAAPPAGYSLSGNFGYATGTSGSAAAPAADASRYLYVAPELGGNSATLSTFDLSAVSIYWGSIDTYNSVDVLLQGGGSFSVSGSAFPPADGGQAAAASNRRVFFTAGAGEVITGLRFNSTGTAFELDNVYGVLAGDGSGSTVPEPSSWAMLIAGFGLIGAAGRRRRLTTVAA